MAWLKGKGGKSSSSDLPPWLLAAVEQQLTSGGLVQPTGCKWCALGECWTHGKGAGKGKGASGPITLGNVPTPVPERPIPPWLAAKPQQQPIAIGGNVKGCGKVQAGKGSGRLRVTASRIQGTLTEWNGTMGWVKPEKPVDHPDAKKNVKGLHLAKADVFPAGHVLSKGMQVTCFVYNDGLKLGAEKCMEFKGHFLSEDVKEKPKPSFDLGKASGSGKYGKGGAKGGKCDLGFKGGNQGMWVFVPEVYQPQYEKFGRQIHPTSKGGGKQKQDGKGKKALPRTRVTEGASVTGKCIEWKGTHGWIEPDVPIDHPKAKANKKGHLYVHQQDIIEVHTLYTGQAVNFHIYEDKSGLGAEECIVC